LIIAAGITTALALCGLALVLARASDWRPLALAFLIALPLQKHRRGDGNSVFLDAYGVPYQDQWAFLSTIPRIKRDDLEGIVLLVSRRGARWRVHRHRRQGRRRRARGFRHRFYGQADRLVADMRSNDAHGFGRREFDDQHRVLLIETE